MSVTLTEKAANEVKKIMADQKYDENTVLRVGVAGGGCSGFQYSLGFDTAFDPKNDTRSEQHGVGIVVDKKSAPYLEGASIDYEDTLHASGFQINNPNASNTCACGDSFN